MEIHFLPVIQYTHYIIMAFFLSMPFEFKTYKVGFSFVFLRDIIWQRTFKQIWQERSDEFVPLHIIRQDITKVHADAIVNSASPDLLGGGGVDGAIHRAAGPKLLKECKALGGCAAGQAKITQAYDLPAKYVIHTVGPVWRDGKGNEENILADCYRNSLDIAKKYKLKSIAFPLISAGAFAYPKIEALKTAANVIRRFLEENEMTVFLVVYDRTSLTLSGSLFESISEYIDDNYVKKHRILRENKFLYSETNKQQVDDMPYMYEAYRPAGAKAIKPSLEAAVNQQDETFSQMLLRLIDEKKMTDAETYKKANIDRKLFSKIRCDKFYKPSKSTAIAFAIALKLNKAETDRLLNSAGYALSRSNKFDIIIQYFIERDNYDIFDINEALFVFEQPLLGA
jgi:O-acetyl-ADP-ribose deacetylase (regulator of RNase III)